MPPSNVYLDLPPLFRPDFFHASDVIHLPHLVQESVYSVGNPPLHARYHQASRIDPEQLVDRFVQQTPAASKRGGNKQSPAR